MSRVGDKAVVAASESTVRALHKGPGVRCGCTQLGTETKKHLLHMLHPHVLTGQVGLKSGCFNSAVCNQLSRCQQLSNEQMSLALVLSPAGQLSSCVASDELLFSLNFPSAIHQKRPVRPSRAVHSFSHFSLSFFKPLLQSEQKQKTTRDKWVF